MPVFYLVYVSIAAEEFEADALLEILRASRENNTRDGVTGILLYKERRFMQLLEGEEKMVRATYARIVRDSRHRDVTILIKGNQPERDFADWSMAFQDLDQETASHTAGYSQFMNDTLSASDFASDPWRAHQLLRIFRRI